ncbi:MAG TPA: CoA-binding protein [Stellaceae bacterium]|jgi:predicted CoA-binding protein|nr:CoA-binding protein [Stellaceae bacterium]
MNHDRYSDDYLRGIFARVKTIAMVGASPRTDRPSNRVMAFLQRKGFRVIPVNPQAAGQTIHGETVVASLAAIAEPIDMVDIFRRSDQVAPVVDDAIAKHAKIVWMQLDVRDDQAAAKAEAAGLDVVMNRCPAIEMPRLGL